MRPITRPFVSEDLAQLLDALDDVLVLGADLVALQRGQLAQPHLHDGVGLHLAELELVHQRLPGGVAVARGADRLDDLVEVVQRDEEAFEDVRLALLLGELELRPPDDDLALVADVGLDCLAQPQRLRYAVDQRDHVDPERRLHRGVLVELVEHDLRDGVALELDDEPHPALVRVVLEVGDPGQLLLADQVGDLGHQATVAALLDHVRELGDDDGLLALLERLDVRARLQPHPSSAVAVGLGCPTSRG